MLGGVSVGDAEHCRKKLKRVVGRIDGDPDEILE